MQVRDDELWAKAEAGKCRIGDRHRQMLGRRGSQVPGGEALQRPTRTCLVLRQLADVQVRALLDLASRPCQEKRNVTECVNQEKVQSIHSTDPRPEWNFSKAAELHTR